MFSSVLHTLLAAPGAPNQQVLAERSGVPTRSIYRILNRVDRSVSFHIADALLCALNSVELWHTPPLDTFLTPPPERSELINPTTFPQDAARVRALHRQAQKGTTR